MLSHSYMTLLLDGRSLGELKQGVTLQIFGEGHLDGAADAGDARERAEGRARGGVPSTSPGIRWPSTWPRREARHLAERRVVHRRDDAAGSTPSGRTTDRRRAAEMDTMRGLVRDEMAAGALGIGSSLIYPPAFFASTEELIELCRAAAPYGGKYISHMRERGQSAARSDRRADPDQPRRRASRPRSIT